MKRIITDTNVWYDFSSEEIKSITEKYRIAIPIIVLNELYTSPKITNSEKSFNKVVRAIETILECRNYIEFIDFNPFEILIKPILPDIKAQSNSSFYLSEFEALIKLHYEQVKNIPSIRKDISGLTDFINATSIENGKEINLHDGTKARFKKFESLEKTKNLIINWVNDNLALVGKFPILTNLDHELLPLIFDKFLRTSSKQGNKFENNDWVDIFILSYVEKEDLYWTQEKRKLEAIKDMNLADYLFDKSSCS